MRNNIYAEYDEKFVKNVILYGKSADNKLYFDAEMTEEVSRDEAKDIYIKGMLITIGDFMCQVGTMKDIPDSEKVEFKVYNGTGWVTYTSYNKVITPVEPTYDDETGVVTIPDSILMSYYVGEEKLTAGAQPPLDYDDPLTVQAVPNDGYSFDKDATSSWTFVRNSVEVTPTAPEFNDVTGVITIPAVTGVIYKDGESTLSEGPMTPLVEDTPKTITAVPDEGYKFAEAVVASWEFELVVTEVEVVAPTFDDATGIITIPDEEGILYTDAELNALTAGAQAPIVKDTPYFVKASPKPKYKFPQGATVEWQFTWTD